MSKLLRAAIRRDIFHKLIDDKNADYEDVEKYIDELMDVITDNLKGLRDLMYDEENLDKYAGGIHRNIENYEVFREGFVTGIENVIHMLQDDKYHKD